jgi:cell wall-associated NlpC family hydrolase
VSLHALLAVNGFTVDTLITPGMRVKLPGASTSVPRIDRVVAYALAQVGKPWRFFTRGPWSFDCSGLTLAAYERVGVSLPHYSAAQAWRGAAVNFYREPIRAGDLVFQDTNHDGVINHVGIAISATRWVEARDARSDVTISPMPPDSRIVAVRRLLPNG